MQHPTYLCWLDPIMASQGAALLDLTLPRLNSFSVASVSYHDMATEAVMQGPMKALFWHFAPPGHHEHAKLLQEVRACLLHQAAHLWFRLLVPSTKYPFRLCRLVDDRFTMAEQLACAEEVYSTPTCCLDPDFTLKVLWSP